MTNNKKRKILVIAGLLDSGDIPLILKKTLEELGHNVEFIPVDEKLPHIEKKLHSVGQRFSRLSLYFLNKRILKEINRMKPDLFFIYGSNWGIFPETLRKIKDAHACKIVLWEGNLQFWRWFQSEALQYYDYVFVNDSYALPMLKGPAKLKHVIHFPGNVCDPDIHRPLDLSNEERQYYGSDIGFIGMGHTERREFFEDLTEFDLKLWGKNWGESEKLKPFFVDVPVGMEEKIRIYQCARINVNIQSKNYQIDGISAKIFEIASCGGFFLTERKKDLSLFFKEEEDMIGFDNIDELKEKITFYLSHPRERNELAEKIRGKVITRYTYKNKLKEFLSLIRQK